MHCSFHSASLCGPGRNQVSTSSLCRHADDATATFWPQMPSLTLSEDKIPGFFSLCRAVIVDEVKSHAYPYTFYTIGEVSSTFAPILSLADMHWTVKQCPTWHQKVLLAAPTVFSPAAKQQARGSPENYRNLYGHWLPQLYHTSSKIHWCLGWNW